MSESKIYGEYISLTKNHQKLYGKNTIVLYQVGAFFEVYGLKSENSDNYESEIMQFSKTCNLNVSEKKATYQNKQVYMAGFRDYNIDKYLEILIQNSFTVVVFVQEKIAGEITRKLDSIHSPGTYMPCHEENEKKITNNIACIWIDLHKPVLQKGLMNNVSVTRENIICGIAIANIFTGTSYISEFQHPFIMEPSTFDELERIVLTHMPSEVIVISPFQQEDVNKILQYSGIHTHIIHNVSTIGNEKVENCSQQKYISHILGKFYGEEVLHACAEFQTYPTATQSFCYLLDFVQEHNPNLVKNIAIPDFHKNSELFLANHTLRQLNILDDHSLTGNHFGHLSSVNSFLNKCCTSMGRRKFFSQIVNPTFDEVWLQEEYDMTAELLLQENYEDVGKIRKLLSQIKDIEKLCRQVVLRKILPSSMYHLYQSFMFVTSLHDMLINNDKIKNYLFSGDNSITLINNQLIEFLERHLHVEICKNVSSVSTFEENFIQRGVNKELDDLIDQQKKNQDLFQYIHTLLNDVVKEEDKKTDKQIEYVKVHQTEKSGVSLQITKKRGLLLKSYIEKNKTKQIDGLNGTKWGDVSLSTASGNADEINFTFLSRIIRELFYQKETMNKLIYKAYLDILETFENEHYENMEKIAQYISKLDVLQNKAYVAKENKYCKPEICSSSKKSFVNAKALRHVLIEHIQKNELYVANDIVLGDDVQNGVLLYGTNAVGKTSFIRALGISVIMAQSGLYVPCSSFQYKPYQAIFSRILGNDNLFKGLSTFAVEMSELRVILKLADENSLVLGDELCSGTETESALSIFVSGLLTMHEKKSSFIFATHFHEIIDYDEIKQLSYLFLKHMAVRYDRESDTLIYDRKLMDGPGNRMYGLEVCKSLYLPEQFLQQAYDIRSKYFPNTRGELANSSAKYNASKIKGICEICDKEIASEIHHILPQKEADKDGFITLEDGSVVHKNHPANLMSVCESCHQKYHENNEHILLLRKKTNKGYKIEGFS